MEKLNLPISELNELDIAGLLIKLEIAKSRREGNKLIKGKAIHINGSNITENIQLHPECSW